MTTEQSSSEYFRRFAKKLPIFLASFLGEMALFVALLLAWQYELSLLIAWSIYLIGAVCLMRVWWYMTRKIPIYYLRQVLRLFQAVILLTPGPVAGIDHISFAPAVVMSAMEGLFAEGGDFARAGVPLLIALGITLVLYLALEVVWSLTLKKRWDQGRQQSSRTEEQLHDHDELVSKSRNLEAASSE